MNIFEKYLIKCTDYGNHCQLKTELVQNAKQPYILRWSRMGALVKQKVWNEGENALKSETEKRRSQVPPHVCGMLFGSRHLLWEKKDWL